MENMIYSLLNDNEIDLIFLHAFSDYHKLIEILPLFYLYIYNIIDY